MTQVIGFPLSPQQEYAWHSLGETTCSHASVRIVGPIDTDRLKAALEHLVTRHEILRTTIVHQPGRRAPLQVVHEDATVAFTAEPLTARDDASQATRMNAARAELNTNRDAEAGPTLHARLLTLQDQKHVLMLSAPLLCADPETLRLVAVEVAQSYAGLDLAFEPVQYADYAEWQRQELLSTDDRAVAARGYWNDVLERSTPPAVLGLSTKQVEALDIKAVRSLISTDEWSRVEAPSRTCLAAWQVLLARLSGAEQICTRVVLAGRSSSDLTNACGLYARSLPIMISVESDAVFADVLERTDRAVGEATAAETYWACEQSSHRDVVFEWHARSTHAVGDLMWSVEQLEGHDGPFALKLSCMTTANGIETTLFYDANAISETDAERVSDQYGALLRRVAGAATRPVWALGLETDAASAIATGTDAGAPMSSVPQWIAAQANATPMARAVVGADAALTYGELMARAAGVAERLRAAGVQQGSVVGVCGDRSAALMVALMGVWQAGAAYLPIGPDQPAGRVADQLSETAAAAVLVTDPSARAALTGYAGPVLNLPQSSLSAPSLPPPTVSPEAAAYVLYTSGSTGRPKGVVVRHRNLVAYTAAVVATLRAAGIGGQGVQWATVSALTADLGNTCLFPALVSGGCLHLVPPAATLDGSALAAYMASAKVDVLKITPSHLAAVLETRDVLPRRALIFGGEVLSWELTAKVRQLGECAIWNHYGPTETTVGALMHPVPENAGPTRTVPIGRPLGGVTVAVVDVAGVVVPVGVPGELWIGGAGVAAGYIGQPEVTAERFVTPSWGHGPMYRTGDRVWMTAGGDVEFLGRQDDQVKIRGFRVEPGEVEHVLQLVAGVREGVVVAVGDGADRHLVAYVVAGTTPTDADIRSALSARLPDYMVPAVLMRVAALPRLANGKVDRRRLAIEGVRLPAASLTAPRTPVESTLCDLWQTLLSRPAVGIHDRFFEIGGHSLLATRLIAQMRRAFDVQVPLRAIFEHSTVAELAALVQSHLQQHVSADDLLADLEHLSESEAQALLDQSNANEEISR